MFRQFGTVLVLTGLSFNVSAAAVSSYYDTPTLARKQDAVPTVFLGDLSQYAISISDGSEEETPPEKRGVAIDPSGFHDSIPENGIRILLGSDIEGDVERVIREKCSSKEQLDRCRTDVQKILRNTNLQSHTKRFLPLIAAATIAEIVQVVTSAIVAGLGALALGAGLSKVAQSEVNYDGSENGALSQIQSLTDASVIAIATGSDDVVMATVTITVAPTPTPNPDDTVNIEEVTEDSGENHKGDILIHIPDATEQRLRDYLGVIGMSEVRDICQSDREANAKRGLSSFDRRAPPALSEECAEAIAGAASNTLFTTDEDTLAALVPANKDNPMNPEVHPEGAAFPDINLGDANMAVAVGRQAFGRGNGNPNANRRHRILMMAALIVNIIYNAAMRAADLQARLFLIRMGWEMIAKLSMKDIDCASDLVCFDDNCKGFKKVAPVIPIFEGADEIQTGVCTTKENKGCRCELVAVPITHDAELGYFDDLQKFLQALEDSVAHPDCDSSDWLSMDTARFNEAIEGGCKDHNELRRLMRRGLAKRSSWTWENTDNDNLKWRLHWEDVGGECPADCTEVFQKMLYYDKCRWWGGAAKKGSVPTECGDASYEVDVKPEPPPPVPQLPSDWSQYLIVITQQVKPGDWEIEWNLYADPWKTNAIIEGPSRSYDVGGAKFAIHMTVDEPHNKDKTKVRFTLADFAHPEDKREAPWWAAQERDVRLSLQGNWCAVVEKWKTENGVPRRTMRCAFANDLEKALEPDKNGKVR